jgi:hypothetical protein
MARLGLMLDELGGESYFSGADGSLKSRTTPPCAASGTQRS